MGRPKRSNTVKILLVEDSDIERAMFESVLGDCNCHITSATDGNQAYQKLKQNHYELIISDINMPNMDGFELAEKLKNRPDTKFLFLSSRDGNSEKLHAYNNGAIDFISKPVNLELFKSKVQALIVVIKELKYLKEENQVYKKIERESLDFDRESIIGPEEHSF